MNAILGLFAAIPAAALAVIALFRLRRLRGGVAASLILGAGLVFVVAFITLIVYRTHSGATMAKAEPWFSLQPYLRLAGWTLFAWGYWRLMIGQGLSQRALADAQPSLPGRRLAKASWILLLVGVISIPMMVVTLILAGSGQDFQGLGILGLVLIGHGAFAGLCWLASIVCGLCAARHCPHVYWWVVPEICLFAFGLIGLLLACLA